MDDASNGTFLNEEIASLLGVEEPFQKVQVHVLNSAVETFQSMPIKVDIESVSGELRKAIEVKTCPRKVTGTYKVEDWNKLKQQCPHLQRCDFPEPARGNLVDILIGVDNAELHYSRLMYEDQAEVLSLVWDLLAGHVLELQEQIQAGATTPTSFIPS